MKKYDISKALLLLLTLILFVSCGLQHESGYHSNTKETDHSVPSNGVGRNKPENNAETKETQMETSPAKSGVVICVDPGHGFDDGGCSSDVLGTTLEKELTLSYALDLRDALESRGYSVILTHDGSTFPVTDIDNGNNKYSPQERVAYANTLDIDYYVSLHCDSFEQDANVGGTRVYYCNSKNKATTESTDVANSIYNALEKTLPDTTKLRLMEMREDDSYYVIRETTMPASLIEIGFITNSIDVQRILDAEWKKAFINGTAEGIDAFFAENK